MLYSIKISWFMQQESTNYSLNLRDPELMFSVQFIISEEKNRIQQIKSVTCLITDRFIDK